MIAIPLDFRRSLNLFGPLLFLIPYIVASLEKKVK